MRKASPDGSLYANELKPYDYPHMVLVFVLYKEKVVGVFSTRTLRRLGSKHTFVRLAHSAESTEDCE